MRKPLLTAAFGASLLLLSGCGDRSDGNSANAAEATGEAEGAATDGAGGDSTGAGANASGGATAASSWPRGARIVDEGGVTYRIDPDGTRVRLGDTDARIVVENGVRYRVEPGGARVRIDERGLDVDLPDVDVPGVDVDVGVNRKGNPDIDVSTNGTDATPNQ